MNHIERLSRKANELYRKWKKEQMTLQQVKNKYFPNRTLEELRYINTTSKRPFTKQDLEALRRDWDAVGDDFRSVLGENKMNEKIRCVLIDFNGGDTLIVRVEDWKHQVADMDCLLLDGEAGDTFTLSLTDMDEEELDNLPEFEGF